MIYKTPILIMMMCFTVLGIGRAQNTAHHKMNISVPELALLGLVAEESVSTDISMSVPNEAGKEIDILGRSAGRVWVNYSSVLRKATKKRKLIAVVQGELPQGLVLQVEASDYSGNGNGRLGKPTGRVKLSSQPSDVIVDIGSCYTGKGAQNGHCLTYHFQRDEMADNLALLNQSNTSVNVVYTLTDCN